MYKREEEIVHEKRHSIRDYQVLIGLVLVAVAIVVAAFLTQRGRYVTVKKVGIDVKGVVQYSVFDTFTGRFKE